ncbi:MAG: DinB family protein, partial [Bacteroidota bacterium]
INPVGTLALHICGNLRHFIGALLGSDGYQRDRDREFNLRDMPKEQLLGEISDAVKAIESALDGLDPARLNEPMPAPPPHHQGRTIGFFLVQLCCHTHRHQGQLNYLRRINQESK